ncbi:hypothetical protein [Dactylosporangium sp. NPDC051484]|uniref:hypothetical protein n=1 Tax=Dactylosporangium sp. NPDC051484 TaxID=3154942 RepID=UPI00344E856B
MTAAYDLSHVDRLGKRRAKLRAELERVNSELDAEIVKAAQHVTQAELVRRSGLTRESIAQKILPPQQRWKRGARGKAKATPAPMSPADYMSYGERKPVVVADSLSQLSGPTSGTVTLPNHLDWSGHPVYDLDDPKRLVTMYKTVLQEAQTVADLAAWLNADRLAAEWTGMYLPPKVRRLWEAQFPQVLLPHNACGERSSLRWCDLRGERHWYH